MLNYHAAIYSQQHNSIYVHVWSFKRISNENQKILDNLQTTWNIDKTS